LDSNDKNISLAETQFRHIVRIVQSAVPLHNVALKEIAYYLIILKNVHEFSTEILLKLYLKYSVDKPMMEGTLSIHRSCASAFIQDKIDDKLRKKSKKQVEYGFEGALYLSLAYLSKSELVDVLRLSRSIHKKIRNGVYQEVLRRDENSFELRNQIYKLFVPNRFKVQKMLTIEECNLSADNKEIIKLDLLRTCRDHPEVSSNVELVLYNFVKENEETTGYFQGLNFVANFTTVLAKEPIWSLSILRYISEHIFNVSQFSFRTTLTLRNTSQVKV
jgi:hypothetical protein